MTPLERELLPCPFCGSGEVFTKSWQHENGGNYALARCSACGSQSYDIWANEADAAAAWNRRAPCCASSAAAEATACKSENETLRLAICGGEDAPGYAASLPLETILQVQRDHFASMRRDSELAWDGETGTSWKARAEAAEARALALEGALRDAEEVFALCEHPRHVDPQYGAEVEALGERIGYGAMMASAQASWRQKLERSGYPAGGEHVSGPCFGTVQNTLRIIRAALQPQQGAPEEGL